MKNTSTPFELFFDGECPLCRREVAFLQRRDRTGRVSFIDIAGPEFDATTLGKSQAELMGQIHGRTAAGTWVTGVEVFRHLYTAVGLGWVVAPTRWPGVAQLADAAYAVFARHRLRLTGRCANDSCRVPGR